MNADALIIILCNTSADMADEVRATVGRMLTVAEMLPGQANDTEEPGEGVATAVGDVIRDMIARDALTRYGMDVDEAAAQAGMAAAVLGTALMHTNWSEVGRYFFNDARERYAVA